ncbi:MAG: hypothetical protein R2860_05155 [Desulfobacterales bacterium]
MSPLSKIFSHLYFVFYGKTKKIAYADGLDGTPMLPVQAITSIVLCMTGMAGIYLFLKGFLSPPLSVWSPPQIWQVLSKFIRADYRGGGKYPLSDHGRCRHCLRVCHCWLFPVTMHPGHNILNGLQSIWNPTMILFLQALWMATFFYTGRSRVTAAPCRLTCCRRIFKFFNAVTPQPITIRKTGNKKGSKFQVSGVRIAFPDI